MLANIVEQSGHADRRCIGETHRNRHFFGYLGNVDGMTDHSGIAQLHHIGKGNDGIVQALLFFFQHGNQHFIAVPDLTRLLTYLGCQLHRPGFDLGLVPAQFQISFNARFHFFKLKWLGDIIDAAHRKCLHFIQGLGERADEDYRDLAQLLVFFYTAANLKSIQIGHVNTQHDEIRV